MTRTENNHFKFEPIDCAILFFDISGYTRFMTVVENNSEDKNRNENYKLIVDAMSYIFRTTNRFGIIYKGNLANRMGDGGLVLYKGKTIEEKIGNALRHIKAINKSFLTHFRQKIKNLTISKLEELSLGRIKYALHVGCVYKYNYQGKDTDESSQDDFIPQDDFISYHLNLCARIMNTNICRENGLALSEDAWKHSLKFFKRISPPDALSEQIDLKGIGKIKIYGTSIDNIRKTI